MAGQHADQVAALAGADADDADRAGRGLVERGPDPVLDPGQAAGQTATRVIVGGVPGVPVALGHDRHATWAIKSFSVPFTGATCLTRRDLSRVRRGGLLK